MSDLDPGLVIEFGQTLAEAETAHAARLGSQATPPASAPPLKPEFDPGTVLAAGETLVRVPPAERDPDDPFSNLRVVPAKGHGDGEVSLESIAQQLAEIGADISAIRDACTTRPRPLEATADV